MRRVTRGLKCEQAAEKNLLLGLHSSLSARCAGWDRRCGRPETRQSRRDAVAVGIDHHGAPGRRGRLSGTTHLLTEDWQGTFHFTMGRTVAGVADRAGDRVTVETRDAFGRDPHRGRLPSARLTMPFVNPQNGPILVEGARRRATPWPSTSSRWSPAVTTLAERCAMIPEFGARTGTSLTATLNQPLPERACGRWTSTPSSSTGATG